MRCFIGKFVFVLACILILSTNRVYAEPSDAFKKANTDYISALVSMATYSDRVGRIARIELAKRHWDIKSYSKQDKDIDAKFFVVNSRDGSKEYYILAVTGTENVRDVKIDLNFSKVLFGGNEPEEFIKMARTKDTTSKDPMVHRGFNRYTNAAFFTKERADGKTYGEYLVSFLKENPDRKIYMVGHSLGGAIVTIGAARMISLGVDPKQLEVITFGAPAVGNEAFAKQYGNNIPLRRVVFNDDPVKGVLQSVSGGYTQFGEQEVWSANNKLYEREHAIGVYVDSAIRNYYDMLLADKAAGFFNKSSVIEQDGENKYYVAPLDITLVSDQEPDRIYFKEAMYDMWRDTLNGFKFAGGEKESLEQSLKNARAAGCKWLLLSDLDVRKVQDEKFGYYVSYTELIYDVKTGNFKGTFMDTNGTKDFTALQSVAHNLVQAKAERERIVQMN